MGARRQIRAGRTPGLVLLALGLTIGIGGGVWWWFLSHGEPYALAQMATATDAPAPLDAETVLRIERFCSDCHGLPRPDNYPRDVWYTIARRAYSYYVASGRTDLDPPPPHLTEMYFRSRAAEQPPFTRLPEATRPLNVTFTVEPLACSPHLEIPPEVSSLRWTRFGPEHEHVLLVSDMREGGIFSVRPQDGARGTRQLARVNHPCHVETCDLDGDGRLELIVADLGSTQAFDHDRGRVVWLRPNEDESYEPVTLLDHVGRIADVRPLDADGDGDQDLVVAEFGARRSGNILLLKNVTVPGQPVQMQTETVDPRPGTTHVPVVDLNGDQHPDFVAVVTQEYECVDAFINGGDGVFRRQPLWAGPDPAFGSNGLEFVDMDHDGDLDILHTNGDMFDDQFLKPSHGVRWLENRGNLQFTSHPLVNLPGTCVARSGDMDGDGDLDVIVVAWVTPQPKPAGTNPAELTSIVCLEQTAPGVFACHTLERGKPFHAALEVTDFDGDGDLDFAVGLIAPYRGPSLEVWWNRGPAESPPASLDP